MKIFNKSNLIAVVLPLILAGALFGGDVFAGSKEDVIEFFRMTEEIANEYGAKLERSSKLIENVTGNEEVEFIIQDANRIGRETVEELQTLEAPESLQEFKTAYIHFLESLVQLNEAALKMYSFDPQDTVKVEAFLQELQLLEKESTQLKIQMDQEYERLKIEYDIE